jgi:RNA polymerase sigma-70 factor (ECF subfamily)
MIWKRRKSDNPEADTSPAPVGPDASSPEARPNAQALGPDAAEISPDAVESPQLSPTEGVPNDMTSVAIGGAFPAPSSLAGSQQLRFSDPKTLAAMEDAQVMLRVRDGDDAAFNYLVQRYRRAMIGFMYRMVHNAAIAEELSQEVFLRVYRSRANYSADAKFSTWLYRIATNLAVNHARDNKNERPEVKASLDETDEETGLSIDLADDRPNIEQEMLRRERLRAIRKHVEALPERQRIAVTMHKYQEMDYRQIAEVLHLSESATKSLLFRAYETLRESLKDFV